MMRVCVLGPVEVRASGENVSLGGDRQQAVLAILVAARGQVVSADRLAEQVWNGAPPARAGAGLQVYVSRLRRLLEPERLSRSQAGVLVTEGGGYALRLPAAAVDAWIFEQELHQAADLPAGRALELLESALQRWRGQAYEQFADEPWARGEIARLHEARSVARERLVMALLRLGRTADAVLAARALAEAEPLRGEAWRLLALGLWASHRSADALEVLRAHHIRLGDELGLDPEPELAALERSILEQRSGALIEVIGSPGAVVRPAQLPRAGAVFSGRSAELAELERTFGTPVEAPLAVIAGGGGVGKTTVALHWAHRMADRYPDGQLYADLRGFGPEDAPANPLDVLFAFLTALGVPEHRVPPSRDERVALYRSVLAGRRMLLVLDNARDAAQVRPLLPGARGCAVIVTGRGGLAGLVVAEGAHLIRLDAFGAQEAREYLRTRLGSSADVDPVALDAVVFHCGGLPLALAVVGARAARYSLAAVAAELAEEQGLDAFSLPGDTNDPRSVFSWSYRHLPGDAAELFRQLALHPGPYVTLDAATAVAGGDRRRTHRLLRHLNDAHLIVESMPGRFVYHDLLRAYAHELPGDQRQTLDRLIWHHLYATANAAKQQHPLRQPVVVGQPPPEMSAPAFADQETALSWLEAEYDNIVALISLRPDLFGRFVWALGPFQQDVRYQLDDSITLILQALPEAEREDDQWWIGYLNFMAARAYLRRDQAEEARPHLLKAIAVGRATGDLVRLAHGLMAYAMTITPVNAVPTAEQAAAAFPYVTEARDTYRKLATEYAASEEANTLGTIGWHHYYQPGGRDMAFQLMHEAVEVRQRWSDSHAEANARMELGRLLLLDDQVQRATSEFRQALELVGDRRVLRIEPLVGLYQCHVQAGDESAAQQARDEALSLLQAAHYPDIERITTILNVR